MYGTCHPQFQTTREIEDRRVLRLTNLHIVIVSFHANIVLPIRTIVSGF